MAIEGHLHQLHRTKAPAATGISEREPAYNPVNTLHQQVLFMQRTVGNRAVNQLVAQRRLHPKTGHVMREEAPASEEQPTEELPPLTPLQDVQVDAPSDSPDETDHGRVVTLRGLTTAHWSQSTNSAQTSNLQFQRSSGCSPTCAEGDPCISVSATLTCSYNVPIDVSLPDLSAMDLNECERQQAQNWIDTVLAPHEQQHVQKFSTYNGTTTRTISFTSCNSTAQATLAERAQTMLDTERASRQSSAQALSDALDPFNFNFELNCPEPEEEAPEGGDSEGSADGGE